MLTVQENIADVMAVLMVCVTLTTVIAGKLEERQSTGKIQVTWLIYEVGTLLIAGYLAWEIYPNVNTWDWMTRNVFVVLAMHGGARTISLVKSVAERGIPTK